MTRDTRSFKLCIRDIQQRTEYLLGTCGQSRAVGRKSVKPFGQLAGAGIKLPRFTLKSIFGSL